MRLRQHFWWLRRLAVVPIHLLIFSLAVFLIVRMVPGDPVLTLAGGQPMSHQQYEAAQRALGLSGSIFDQLGTYLYRVVTLNFGTSIVDGTNVLAQLGTRLPETLELAVIALTFTIVLTACLSFLAVLRPRLIVSRVIVVYARAAGALPDFCLGVLGIILFYSTLHIAPAPIGFYSPDLNPPTSITGFPILDAVLSGDSVLLGSMLAHLWLPTLVLVLAYAPILTKLFMRSLEQAIEAQATRFRIASGASRSMVMLSIARRALPSTVAMLGMLFGLMLGGVVVVEQLFAIPGMGLYAVQAVQRADFVALQGFLLLIGLISLLVYFLVDVVNMLLDPRRRPAS